MDQELKSLIGRLTEYSKGCEDKCLDFQAVQFEAKESESRLHTPMRSYFFKSDPKNPRDPKIVHALKQFCGICGIPYTFFAKNPEFMKNQIVQTWLTSLKPEKSAVLAKLRITPGGKDYIIRALLPVEFTNIPNAEILTMISDVIGDDFYIDFVIGEDRDDLLLHVRFISKDTFDVGDEVCSTGFSVITSELGAAPISIETMLFRTSSKAAMIAGYSGESYFESDYEGIQPSALRELFPRLVQTLKDQLPEIKHSVHSAIDKIQKKEEINDLLRLLRLKKGLGEKFHRLLFQEVENNQIESRWDFVNRVSILAKDFDSTARIKIEKASGELIGLIFDKA